MRRLSLSILSVACLAGCLLVSSLAIAEAVDAPSALSKMFPEGWNHRLDRVFAIMTATMGGLRVAAEVLSRLSGIALARTSPTVVVVGQGLRFAAWAVGAFSLGAPKSIPGPRKTKDVPPA